MVLAIFGAHIDVREDAVRKLEDVIPLEEEANEVNQLLHANFDICENPAYSFAYCSDGIADEGVDFTSPFEYKLENIT